MQKPSASTNFQRNAVGSTLLAAHGLSISPAPWRTNQLGEDEAACDRCACRVEPNARTHALVTLALAHDNLACVVKAKCKGPGAFVEFFDDDQGPKRLWAISKQDSPLVEVAKEVKQRQQSEVGKAAISQDCAAKAKR